MAYPNQFTAKVVVEEAGGRPAVIAALEWFRDHGGNPGRLFGLVDRDEWDNAAIAAQTAALPQLRVVPSRDCLESYFTDPDELEPSLQAENAAYAGQFPAFRAYLEAALPARTAHWALFTTKKTGTEKKLHEPAMYPGAFHASIPIPADADIQQQFQVWAGLIHIPNSSTNSSRLRAQILARRHPSDLSSHVSAKRFFEEIVHPAPEGLQRFRVKSNTTWRLDLAENAPSVPADIAAILQPLLV